ncbi:MAG: MBL fold metallo-hydrolase [Syntrophomonadaceae bacterium]|nr:MBL fold metallo-hydrolase [Syntrophomonadaceae bacterium]
MQIQILVSGSSGNAIFFELGNTKILIDAGISARRIEYSLAGIGVRAGDLDAILITHEHRDHVSGVEVLARKHRLPVYARPRTWDVLGFRDSLDRDCRRELSDSADIGQVKVVPFPVSHDASDPVGFCLYHRQSKYVIATDLGVVTPVVREAMGYADAIIIETNHDLDMLDRGPYPLYLKRRIRSAVGHLSNAEAAELLSSIDRKPSLHVFLAHLSQKNNRPALAEKTVRERLLKQGCEVGHEVVLHMTYPDRVSGFVR